MKEKRKIPGGFSRESWEFHLKSQKKLADRIAYHERKIEEEREAKANAPRRRTLRERFGF